MLITVNRTAHEVEFRLANVPEAYKATLRNEYYREEGDLFLKAYPRDTVYIENIVSNLTAGAEAMLAQLSGSQPAPWRQALAAFAARTREAGIDWFLTGSAVLALRGLAVEPKDINVVLSMQDLRTVRDMFKEHMVTPVAECSDWVAKGYGMLFLHSTVTLAFDTDPCLDVPLPIDAGPYAKAHLETLFWEGFALKVPPLELLLNINKLRGRYERVELIEGYLKGQHTQPLHQGRGMID